MEDKNKKVVDANTRGKKAVGALIAALDEPATAPVDAGKALTELMDALEEYDKVTQIWKGLV
jgi:hypothetical protein